MAMTARSARWRVVSSAMESSSSERCEPGRARVGRAGGEGGNVRCQAAAVSTGLRELEVDVQRAALRGSFEAASVSGSRAEECRMYYGRRGGGDAFLVTESSFTPAAQEDVQTGKSPREMVAAFEAALVGAGRNADALCEIAMRAWRKLGDADRAEQLFLEALQVAPENSAVQASYAQFLWQCDT